jgi:hypothetical protein
VRGDCGYLLLLRFEQRKQLRVVHLATPGAPTVAKAEP